MDNDSLKCVICGNNIFGQYRQDIWGNCICAHHQYKVCYSCLRFIGRYSTYSSSSKQIGFQIHDGRQICGICQETCVVNQIQVEDSANFVIRLLNKAGIKIKKERLSIQLVTKNQMERTSPGAEGLNQSFFGINPRSTVSKIFIPHAMPKIKFESILAHEMLHWWLHYNDVADNEMVEGFCNIGESLVLNYYASRKQSDLAKLLRYFENENDDFHYGLMFQIQKQKLQRMGWTNYIKDILDRKMITP